MFVPKAALSSAASLRNPRRRQRTSSDESVKPPSAKRQRSALRQENSKLNPGARRELDLEIEPLACSPSEVSKDLDFVHSLDGTIRRNIPFRVSRKAEKRQADSDEAVLLSKTEFYTVSQLPALLDQIRSLQSEPFRCFFAPNNGYGLAITMSHAIIWPFSMTTSSPSATEVFRLSIPESCQENNDRTPLGIILSTATNASPGLMVLMPCNGRIIYWETVSSAASLGLSRQRQTGIQISIHGMLSGEYATDIVNGEPSGVFVTFSSGRVAHITVRDSQGKPSVIVNFLKNSSSSGGAGLLGGLKNALGGGFWRKDVAAVRAGESHQRGQRDIIIATSTGMVEIWDTHWNTGSMLKRQFDVRNQLHELLGARNLDRGIDNEIRILDFAFTPANSLSPSISESLKSWQISVLVARYSEEPLKISVIQLMLSDPIQILSSNPVNSHSIPTSLDGPKPRLFVPNPAETAFIVMGQSVILLSLLPVEASPSSQLLAESCSSQPFQDSIHLRTGKDYDILGMGFEDQSGESSSPTCLLMIREFGVIRITALPLQKTTVNNEDAQITAQHKMEQAVFYGTMLGNPLNLASRKGFDFPLQEIEEAALEICKELLHSTSKFIPTTAISIDQNLKLRAKALDDLSHLLMQQNKAFDRRVWWELLWAAEKLAAQRAMWKVEEASQNARSKGPTFLAYVLELMSEKFKTRVELTDGRNDLVRHWFLYDTFQMEHIVPWIFNAIKPQKSSAPKQMRRISEHILEAGELSLAVLETAFRYRDEHSHQFGIGDGYLEDGVLISGYDSLPEFWTSRGISYTETGHLLDLELDSCRARIQKTAVTTEASDNLIIKGIASNASRHLRVLGQMHSERTRWLSVQEDPKLVDEGIAAEQLHVKQRKWQLFKLAGIGQLEDAIDLAEKFRDMGALVELIIELQDQSKSEILPQDPSDHISNGATSASKELNRKISHYFEKFGEAWADAFFSRQITMGQSGILFSMKRFQPFITRFLHKNPIYSRLGWINNVLGERDFETAANNLENLALEHETDVWSHRVELSLAKLAKLAAWEETPSSDHSASQNDIRRLEDFTEIGAVQEVIHAYISPVLQGAIDQKAEIDLAVDHFGHSIAGDRPSLHEQLTEALANVICRKIIGVDELVDVLTLIDPRQVPGHGQNELIGREFYLALRVIRLGHQAKHDPRYHLSLQKLVWRRCIIRDNWEATGKAVEKMGSESESILSTTSLFRTLVFCLKDKHSEDSSYPSLYLPTSPHDVLMSDSDSTILTSRFRPERRSRIARDLDKENTILSHYIEKGELDFWFKNMAASANKEASNDSYGMNLQPSDDVQPNQSTSLASPTNQKARLSWL